ncbi:hypothetical protein FA95DRAFT_1075888 [Auriscalpium vulgare]|uniref:Uncharacterized protein n=1 Tax=Auriscalpium vulgare TaxID=40419 RepID=A0ACB8RWK1_9AGAM|nr:hypothetical protein FA95DRAFT_1075888 [Auriscalpium vulgare]
MPPPITFRRSARTDGSTLRRGSRLSLARILTAHFLTLANSTAFPVLACGSNAIPASQRTPLPPRHPLPASPSPASYTHDDNPQHKQLRALLWPSKSADYCTDEPASRGNKCSTESCSRDLPPHDQMSAPRRRLSAHIKSASRTQIRHPEHSLHIPHKSAPSMCQEQEAESSCGEQSTYGQRRRGGAHIKIILYNCNMI